MTLIVIISSAYNAATECPRLAIRKACVELCQRYMYLYKRRPLKNIRSSQKNKNDSNSGFELEFDM
jgi:hypothetical protein